MIGVFDIQKSTLIDFPGHIASTVFIQGCNFNCPWCHNRNLIKAEGDIISIDEVIKVLEKRKNFLDGVAFTGGEPTLYEDLPILFKKIKELKLKVKLDTNGTNPDLLEELLSENLVDYIAMDIKADFENYDKMIGKKCDCEILQKSVDIIKNSDIAYEFRTTVVPTLIEGDIIDNIINDIFKKEVRKYVLQRYLKVESFIQKGDTKEEWKKLKERYASFQWISFRDNF